MKPVLKWLGSKTTLFPQLKPYFHSAPRLIEPFVGGASIFTHTDYPQYILNDLNKDLFYLYTSIQTYGIPYIHYCKGFFLPYFNHPDRYYALREEFNIETDPSRRGALFLYLNRHGFNGLCRYNKKGIYNVSYGKYKKPYFPEKELYYFYQKSQAGVSFTNYSFEQSFASAQVGDIIYCDPPYLPIKTNSNNFTRYTSAAFSIEHHCQLAHLAIKAQEKGIQVLISNTNSPLTDEIFDGAKQKIIVSATRKIAAPHAKNSKNKKVYEALFIF